MLAERFRARPVGPVRKPDDDAVRREEDIAAIDMAFLQHQHRIEVAVEHRRNQRRFPCPAIRAGPQQDRARAED